MKSLTALLACGATALAAADAGAETLALRYDVYAGGTHAVEIEAELEVTQGTYRLGTALELVGMYALVSDWHMAATARGGLSPAGIVPTMFSKVSEGGERWAEIAYADGVILNAQGNPSPSGEDTSMVPAEIKAAAIDPLSGVVRLLNQVAATGDCGGVAQLYDGKSYFTVTATDRGRVAAPETDYGVYSGPAVLCRLTVDSDAPYGRTDEDVQTADVWIAQPMPGGPAVMVRLETMTKYGAVRIHLADFWPVGSATARVE